MRFVEGPRVPTVVVAIDGAVLVVHLNVPKDLCACWIGRDNLRLTMKQTSCLIEIDRTCDIRGDRRGHVTRFGNRVDLDGECYRNTHLAQLAGEFDRLCSTPTVPVDDNGSLPLFKRREDAIVIGIEKARDLMESFLSM